MNRYALDGKIAIITGGAGGIGRSIAKLMLASGASVCLWDISAAALEHALEELAAPHGKLTARAVDITDAEAVATAAAAEHQAFGRVDVLVNNAGILGQVTPSWDTDPDDFRKVIEVNLIGAYLCLRAAVRLMRTQSPRPYRGHVVNVASIQGKEGMPLAAAYSASKAGLMALTKSAAKEVATEGIYINCITPAAAETAMAKLITPARRVDILSRIPMGRFVEVDEIARMVAWLASDDCSFSTGAIFDLSGGRATY
ncbi:MAG TPA: SDR family NAD(P)-dependent oxidoreductase [Alphaproteobacteria bacterium]|nr:SDR family NAD(P)-dependent oxidoreductase [Alphaproteobacteria bacterium]